jgi:hypothetical protein
MGMLEGFWGSIEHVFSLLGREGWDGRCEIIPWSDLVDPCYTQIFEEYTNSS